MLVGTAVTASADSGFYKCVNAALHGPEAKQVRALDHEFDCKPVKKIRIAEGTTHYSGHLSHHLTWRPNDEVYYEFKVIDGVLKEDSIKTTIDGGGAGWVVGYALTAVGRICRSTHTAKNWYISMGYDSKRGFWSRLESCSIGFDSSYQCSICCYRSIRNITYRDICQTASTA